MRPSQAPLTAVRLDKWLWAVRLFKTRALATEACRRHRVQVNGQPAKPSRDVHVGEKIQIKEEFITREYEVTGLVEKRVSPKLAADLKQELTDPALIAQAQQRRQEYRLGGPVFTPGAGRPTKFQRRELEAFYRSEDLVRAWNRDHEKNYTSDEEEEDK